MTTEPRKRGRPAKHEATWNVGKFTASFEDDHYILRSGPNLIMRTKSEDVFKNMCGLIEQAR